MNQTLYPSASDRRTTPRHSPLSLLLALLVLLLCATFPVASEQPKVMSGIGNSDISISSIHVFDMDFTHKNNVVGLSDKELSRVEGRHTDNAKLGVEPRFAVILWDEVKGGKERGHNKLNGHGTNLQRNRVSYSSK